MTNKFVIIFIILAGIFTAWFGTQTVRAGCKEYWDCPTNNYCDICEPKNNNEGICVAYGTTPRTCNSAPTPTPNNGGVTPPVPVPAPETNTGRCAGITNCNCGTSNQCGDHINISEQGDSVCVQAVNLGGIYSSWACEQGIWVPSGVTPPKPDPEPAPKPDPAPGNLKDCSTYRADLLECSSSQSLQGANVCTSGGKTLSCCQNGKKIDTKTNSCVSTSPQCDSVNYDQPTGRTKTVAGENSGCPQKEMKNECGQTKWGDNTTDNCPAASQKTCGNSYNDDCSVDSNSTQTCTGQKTRTCNSATGEWVYNTSSCDCSTRKYRWDDGLDACVQDENGPYTSQLVCQSNHESGKYDYDWTSSSCLETSGGYYSSLSACQQNDGGLTTPSCILQGIAFCTRMRGDGFCLISVPCAPGNLCMGTPGDAGCVSAPVLPPPPVPRLAPYCYTTPILCNAASQDLCISRVSCPLTYGDQSYCSGADGSASCVNQHSGNGVVININVKGSIISNALITFFAGGKKVQEARTDSVGNLSLILDQKAVEENTEFIITVEKQGYKTFKTTWRPGQGVSYFMQIQLEKGDLKDNGGQANINAQGISYQLDAGWNFVSINLQSEINTAKKLTDEVNRQGGQVIFISRWLGDRWESYVPNAGSADFAVEPGKSYMIKVGKKSEFTLSGNPQKDSLTKVEKGWNAVSFPLLEKQTETADGKLKALNGSIISRFSSGLWDTYARLGNPIQVYGNDYELDSRQGYFVKVE